MAHKLLESHPFHFAHHQASVSVGGQHVRHLELTCARTFHAPGGYGLAVFVELQDLVCHPVCDKEIALFVERHPKGVMSSQASLRLPCVSNTWIRLFSLSPTRMRPSGSTKMECGT